MSRRARLGQHFLHDPEFIERSVAAISPRPGDAIVEIGPGRGALTLPLLDRTGSLDVIEVDRDLARRLPPRTGLRVHVGDALSWPLESLARGGNRIRVAGNLPYYLSTPLLFRLFEQAGCIEDMHFMLQREVVERMTAEPGTAAYGRLGLMVRCHAEARALFEVPPEAFRPPPPGVVRVRPPAAPAAGSGERRGRVPPRGDEGLHPPAQTSRQRAPRDDRRGDHSRPAAFDPGRRPGTLSFEEFAELARAAVEAEAG